MAKLKLRIPISSINLLLTFFFFLLTLSLLFPSNHAKFSEPISRDQLGLNNQKQTHLTFYFHDTLSGPNPTAVPITKPTTMSFGALTMIDDPLTDGPDPTTRLLGRAQGMYGLSDQAQSALTMVMNLAFLEGDFKGSTLSVLGRNPVGEGVREMPVVGGTGAFRFAKGYVQARTSTADLTTGDAVVKYDVYVSHADTAITASNDALPLRRASLSTTLALIFIIKFFCS